MADPFVAEIRIFPFDFAPTGWAVCDGAVLPISQNAALYSLLGTTYGGSASSYALPNMQGSIPLQRGQGPGLSNYDLGQTGGSPVVTLLPTEIPTHNHELAAATANYADSWTPESNVPATTRSMNAYAFAGATSVTLSPFALQPAGGDMPHNNLQPYLVMNFCIALQGVWPSANDPEAPH